jgi:hypothetical protein
MDNSPGRGHGPRQPWSRPRGAVLGAADVAAVAGLVLLAAACGGSPSPAGSGGSPAPGGSASPAAGTQPELAFARCVRSHGVPGFPDPDSSGHFPKREIVHLPVSMSQLRAAMAPCQRLLPDGLSGRAPLTVQEQQDYLKAVACMRSHGIASFPDPAFSGGSVSFPGPPPSIDTSSPQFLRAEQICRRDIPAGLPDSGRGSGG